MASIEQSFGTSNQGLTITLASLANAALRESTGVSNAVNNFQDVLVSGVIATHSSGWSGSSYVNIYAYGSADGGTICSGGATGVDAAFSGTAQRKANLVFVRAVECPTTSQSYEWGPISIASVFGCVPAFWGIVVENLSGSGALAASGSSIHYQGVKSQSV